MSFSHYLIQTAIAFLLLSLFFHFKKSNIDFSILSKYKNIGYVVLNIMLFYVLVKYVSLLAAIVAIGVINIRGFKDGIIIAFLCAISYVFIKYV